MKQKVINYETKSKEKYRFWSAHKRVMSIILVLAMLFSVAGGIAVQSGTASAKNYYFAGKYKGSKGWVDMEQYSSPEPAAYGLNVGYARFYNFKNKKKNREIQLYRKSTNVYEDREGFLRIIVKKKSIVVKGGIPNFETGMTLSLKGKYKVRERFYS